MAAQVLKGITFKISAGELRKGSMKKIQAPLRVGAKMGGNGGVFYYPFKFGGVI